MQTEGQTLMLALYLDYLFIICFFSWFSNDFHIFCLCWWLHKMCGDWWDLGFTVSVVVLFCKLQYYCIKLTVVLVQILLFCDVRVLQKSFIQNSLTKFMKWSGC